MTLSEVIELVLHRTERTAVNEKEVADAIVEEFFQREWRVIDAMEELVS